MTGRGISAVPLTLASIGGPIFHSSKDSSSHPYTSPLNGFVILMTNYRRLLSTVPAQVYCTITRKENVNTMVRQTYDELAALADVIHRVNYSSNFSFFQTKLSKAGIERRIYGY